MNSIDDCLREHFGSDIRITKRHSLGGGCICEANCLHLSNGERVFCKSKQRCPADMFAAEAAGLTAMRQAPGGPRIPSVLGHGPNFLLLEFIPSGGKGDAAMLGQQLAAMHRHCAQNHGLELDNYIGQTRQTNTADKDWCHFFAKHRLGFQRQLLASSGQADRHLLAGIDRLCEQLDRWLPRSVEASILHGDLWSGNIMYGQQGQGVLIDPASYYGHREADLAMSELFGRQDQAFYDAYHESWPLEPGYEERRDLYNCYHLLNHLLLFGSSYASSAMAIIRKYSA